VVSATANRIHRPTVILGARQTWPTGHVYGSHRLGGDWCKALKNQMDDCALLPGTWCFAYGVGDDGREWTAKSLTGVFQ
jgi:hypothetical protein